MNRKLRRAIKRINKFAQRSLAERPVLEPKKLPFVWELNHCGTISYAVGTNHDAPEHYLAHARELMQGKRYLVLENLQRKLDYFSRHQALMGFLSYIVALHGDSFLARTSNEQYNVLEALRIEHLTPLYGTPHPISVESQLRLAAKETETARKGIETGAEMEPNLPPLRKGVSAATILNAWMNGDENTLTRLVDENQEMAHRQYTPSQQAYHRGRNTLMATRSLPYLRSPSVIAVGAGHFCTSQDSLLTLYQEKGITVKRI